MNEQHYAIKIAETLLKNISKLELTDYQKNNIIESLKPTCRIFLREYAETKIKNLALSGVGKCPNLTSVWNEAVTKQENNEHSLFVTNDCWGALETLEKHGLCKINKY
tara:strand:+ start:16424 stop:16747 length:324 start_codon:yes stop_codon:yes gene_type:complete